MDDIKTLFEGKIDLQGQRLADRINQEIIVLGAIVSLILGFVFESMAVMMGSFGAFSVVAFLLVVPPWSFYNRYETQWLPNRPPSSSSSSRAGDSSGKGVKSE